MCVQGLHYVKAQSCPTNVLRATWLCQEILIQGWVSLDPLGYMYTVLINYHIKGGNQLKGPLMACFTSA